MTKVVLIGAGNVASSMGPALQSIESIEILQVWSHTSQSAETLAKKLNCLSTTDLNSILPDADIYVYALKDSVLQTIINSVNCTNTNALHIHTAGSIGLDVFGADKQHCGVIYPFQTFSRTRQIPMLGVPLFIEGHSDNDIYKIKQLAQQLSGCVFDFTSENRKWLHLAGVFANNFSNVMFGIATEIVAKAGLSKEILLPIMHETVNKLHDMTAQEAQTGPAARGDNEVVKQQYELLTDDKQRAIYKLISEMITNKQ